MAQYDDPAAFFFIARAANVGWLNEEYMIGVRHRGNALLMLTLGFAVASASCTEAVFKEEYGRLRSIEIGMTDTQVVQKLGAPDEVHDAATAPENYYVGGYAYEKRSIANKVFIYIEAEPIAYVYFDHNNRVEYVFVSGS